MKCRYCGREIPEGMLFCQGCGREIRIVPDYNPLEDMLTEQIRGSINGDEGYDDYLEYDSLRNTDSGRGGNGSGRNTAGGMSRSTRSMTGRGTVRDVGNGAGRSTMRDMRDGAGRSTVRDMRDGAGRSTMRDMRDTAGRSTVRDMRDTAGRSTGRDVRGQAGRSTGRDVRGQTGRGTSRDMRGQTGRNTGNTGRRNTGSQRGNATGNMSEREKKRRQAERKKAVRRKRAGCALVVLFLIAAIAGAGFYLYLNSYKGIVDKGNKALAAGEYNRAIDLFERAVKKDGTKAAAYEGLAKVYIAKGDLDWAESIFQEAVKKQPKNPELFEVYVNFYMETDQKGEIPFLLEDVAGNVAEALAGYIIDVPEFSLDENETFEDVQELSLSAGEGCTIYYTDNGEEATLQSTKYTGPIKIGEGSTVITAIAVDKKGVPSLAAQKTYTVELPVVDAPAVSPSTGQYDTPVQIEIKVPEGYDAYYTMNGEDPSISSSKYTGPIDMPEGETLFKAVLINGKGRTSGVTTRNYVLEPSEE